MHVSPAKHSYAWLPRKCDYRTDTHTHTDRQTPDKVIPMCRYASQATQKTAILPENFVKFHSGKILTASWQFLLTHLALVVDVLSWLLWLHELFNNCIYESSTGIREADINVAEGKKRSKILISEAFQQEQVNRAQGKLITCLLTLKNLFLYSKSSNLKSSPSTEENNVFLPHWYIRAAAVQFIHIVNASSDSYLLRNFHRNILAI